MQPFLIAFYCMCFAASMYAQNTNVQLPFHTQGSRLVDQNGVEFRFKGVNWWGMNGSQYPYSIEHAKGINTHAMPFGLHIQHLDTIVNAIAESGFNTVRLPFSNQMLHDSTRMIQAWCGPNIQLVGKTPIEVMDYVITALNEAGIFVLLNNHSTTTHWCCNYDFNGLWYGKNKFYSQSTNDWIADWVMLAKRYTLFKNVVGADLRNEVRPLRMKGIPLPKNPRWGGGMNNDWHKAATRAGNAIQKVTPEWLIVVEGINARVVAFSQLRFPHLKPVKRKPVVLNVPNKVVYEVHNYSFSWLRANLLFKKRQIRYSDIDANERVEAFEKNWGFLMNSMEAFAAPVVLGEFGCSASGNDVEPWLSDLTRYVQEKNMGFFWWTLEEELESEGSYGIMNKALDKVNVGLDWRGKYLLPMLKN